jgi:tetratricopeptide (TPR) repeat protein
LSGFKQLVGEVHRRSLWQVLGIYLGASWIVLQVVEIMTESVGLPDWVQPFAIVLLLIGFPIVLATAFVQEGVRARDAAPGQPDATPAERPASESAVPSPDPTESPTASARPEVPAAGDQAGQGTHHRLFTWRNALLGGAAAFTLLGIVTAVWMVTRTLGIGPAATLVARGVLDERDRVIVAEFTSETGDSLLARAATEALRVDLSQSTAVMVVEPRYVTEVLRRMERDPSERLSAEIASEVAIREGIKAVVAGEINSAGSGYVLTAELMTADGDQVLVSQRETAADSTRLIGAIDQLSKGLRERIGESLKSIQADDPLEQATTASLDALRMYSQAVYAIEVEGRPEKGITLLEEAVALDSSFAMAWRKLGVALGNRGEEPSRAIDALQRAYDHRDRLTRVERFITIGSYYDNVTDETDKSIAAYENALEAYPDHPWVLNNLALQYGELRDLDREEDLLRRSIRADSTSPLSYLNLVFVQAGLGKPEEARATLETYEARFPESPRTDEMYAYLASSTGDYGVAVEHVERVRAKEARSLFWRAFTSTLLGNFAAAQGKLAEAAEHYRAALSTHEERGLEDQGLGLSLNMAFLQVRVAGEQQEAVRLADEALDRWPLETMDPLDRPYLTAASALARAGQTGRARALLEEFEAAGLVVEDAERDLHWIRGEIALAEGRTEEAVRELRRAHGRADNCRLCALSGLAEAYARSGEADSALAVYTRYLETPVAGRIWGDRFNLGPTYEALGGLHDENGDWEKAAEYYAKFVELWAEADPVLQPRVEAAQGRLDEIFAERG